jgi:hypothetical protein
MTVGSWAGEKDQQWAARSDSMRVAKKAVYWALMKAALMEEMTGE